ncbi:hypothetical protein STAN_6969 [Streptomyces sp. CBMAI 2042]|nr:hypothetical protein STAN_6969 [Streptomyces sp. CBMAI 2042]
MWHHQHIYAVQCVSADTSPSAKPQVRAGFLQWSSFPLDARARRPHQGLGGERPTGGLKQLRVRPQWWSSERRGSALVVGPPAGSRWATARGVRTRRRATRSPATTIARSRAAWRLAVCSAALISWTACAECFAFSASCAPPASGDRTTPSRGPLTLLGSGS